jgi:glycosyltransferase involved in cell wall biosynthesis
MDVRTLPVHGRQTLVERLRWWRFASAVRCASRHLDGVTTITPNMTAYLESQGYLTRGALVGEWPSGAIVTKPELASTDGGWVAAVRRLPHPRGVYLGALSPDRGIEEMLAATQQPESEGAFVVVGDGPLLRAVEARARSRSGIPVVSTGRVSHREALELLQACDYGVSPLPARTPWNVSSPLKVLEYVAAGLPVAVTNIPAHYEMLRGYGAVAFAAQSTAACMARACLEAASLQPDERERAALMSKYSWPAVASQLNALLLKTVKECGSRGR